MVKAITGRQIRAARALAEMTIADLSEATGISAATVQAIETTPDDAPADKHKIRAAARAASVEKITAKLTAAGVSFLPDDGKAGPGLRYRGK
jgi:transcriptional regulator with XRE-family HTH domain